MKITKKRSSVGTGLRTAGNTVSLAMLGLKTAADVKKHKHDGFHNQQCECFSMCTPCQIEAIRNKKKTQQ